VRRRRRWASVGITVHALSESVFGISRNMHVFEKLGLKPSNQVIVKQFLAENYLPTLTVEQLSTDAGIPGEEPEDPMADNSMQSMEQDQPALPAPRDVSQPSA